MRDNLIEQINAYDDPNKLGEIQSGLTPEQLLLQQKMIQALMQNVSEMNYINPYINADMDINNASMNLIHTLINKFTDDKTTQADDDDDVENASNIRSIELFDEDDLHHIENRCDRQQGKIKLHRKFSGSQSMLQKRFDFSQEDQLKYLQAIEVQKMEEKEYDEVAEQIKMIFEKDSIDSFVDYYRQCEFDKILRIAAIFNKLLEAIKPQFNESIVERATKINLNHMTILIYAVNHVLPLLKSLFFEINDENKIKENSLAAKQIIPKMIDSYKNVYPTLPEYAKSRLPSELAEFREDSNILFESAPGSSSYFSSLIALLSTILKIDGAINSSRNIELIDILGEIANCITSNEIRVVCYNILLAFNLSMRSNVFSTEIPYIKETCDIFNDDIRNLINNKASIGNDDKDDEEEEEEEEEEDTNEEDGKKKSKSIHTTLTKEVRPPVVEIIDNLTKTLIKKVEPVKSCDTCEKQIISVFSMFEKTQKNVPINFMNVACEVCESEGSIIALFTQVNCKDTLLLSTFIDLFKSSMFALETLFTSTQESNDERATNRSMRSIKRTLSLLHDIIGNIDNQSNGIKDDSNSNDSDDAAVNNEDDEESESKSENNEAEQRMTQLKVENLENINQTIFGLISFLYIHCVAKVNDIVFNKCDQIKESLKESRDQFSSRGKELMMQNRNQKSEEIYNKCSDDALTNVDDFIEFVSSFINVDEEEDVDDDDVDDDEEDDEEEKKEIDTSELIEKLKNTSLSLMNFAKATMNLSIIELRIPDKENEDRLKLLSLPPVPSRTARIHEIRPSFRPISALFVNQSIKI